MSEVDNKEDPPPKLAFQAWFTPGISRAFGEALAVARDELLARSDRMVEDLVRKRSEESGVPCADSEVEALKTLGRLSAYSMMKVMFRYVLEDPTGNPGYFDDVNAIWRHLPDFNQ